MSAGSGDSLTLFLCGDVMTGRGIDQVLPHPSDPRLYEEGMRSALGYVELAERANGPIPRPVDFAYVWGDALEVLRERAPDARLVNLEAAVTASGRPWPGKGIHYRMHPDNVPCLTAAGIDACALANNHVLDWGTAGLAETLATLRAAGLATAGAGADRSEAERPAILAVPGKAPRVGPAMISLGCVTSGIRPAWAAGEDRPGVDLLPDLSPATARRIAERLEPLRGAGHRLVVSIHWGSNWGWEIPPDQRRFARRLIDEGGADVVHGHSSHHPRAIEVHAGRPILYGCGDFVTDYEGIGGYERYRGDLAVGYFLRLAAATGALEELTLVVFQSRRFRLCRLGAPETRWLAQTLDRESRPFGTRVAPAAQGTLGVEWHGRRR